MQPSVRTGRKDGLRVHFATQHHDPLEALRMRCRTSPAFRRLLEAAGYARVKRGKSKPKLSGNTLEAVRALDIAVEAFSQNHRAQLPEGAAAAWVYLTVKRHRVAKTARRTLQQVSKLEAVCIKHQEATLDGFKVRRLLAYSPTISWRAAARLNRLHGPPFFYLVPQSTVLIDEAFDLDLNENEHFRDDQGEYDEAGMLQPYRHKQRETWETAFASREEAWNKEHCSYYRVPTPLYFYPASPALPVKRNGRTRWRIDHHGVGELFRLREHGLRCQQELEHLEGRQNEARALPEAPLYQAVLKRAARNLLEGEHMVTLGRRAALTTDEQEVLAHADTDVPETPLQLLEQQVEETQGKAPRGLVAALAYARLMAQEQTVKVDQYVQGFAALEAASQCEIV